MENSLNIKRKKEKTTFILLSSSNKTLEKHLQAKDSSFFEKKDLNLKTIMIPSYIKVYFKIFPRIVYMFKCKEDP